MSLAPLRLQIDQLDQQILTLLAQRMQLSKKVAQFKKDQNLPISHPGRELEIIQNLQNRAVDLDLDPEFITQIYQLIFTQSKKIQSDLLD